MKSQEQKRDEAMERLIAYEARTIEDQLKLIAKRPGDSRKETERLLRRSATGEKEQPELSVSQPKEKFKKGIKKIKKELK